MLFYLWPVAPISSELTATNPAVALAKADCCPIPTLLNLPEYSLKTNYNVNIGILIPFSFSFTNCSCTSCSKRMRSAARGDWRLTFPLPRRDAKPFPRAFRRPTGPNWLCGRLSTYLLKHVKNCLSSPIENINRENRRLIVKYMLFSTYQ